MSKQRFFTTIMSVIILSVIFQGTNAHEGEVPGYHDQGLITGHSHATIYHHTPVIGSYTATATCSVWASEDPHPKKFVKGFYEISAHARNTLGPVVKEAKTKADYFSGNLFDYVNDQEEQDLTFTGLVANAKGGGSATLYLEEVLEGKRRSTPLYHVHKNTLPSWNIPDNVWEAIAPVCRICYDSGCNVCNNN